jgi:hypothetical protein
MKTFVAIMLVLFAMPALAGSPAQSASKLALELAGEQSSAGLCHAYTVPPRKRAELSRYVSEITHTGFVDETKLTPIDYAVMADDPTNIRRLIALGYNPEHQFNNPLSGAALFGSPKAMKALLSAGVSPNQMYPDGVGSPLLSAVAQNQQALTTDLFNSGANPNPNLESGASPLDYATPCRDQSLINLLVAHGVKSSPRTAKLAHKFGLVVSIPGVR